MVLNIAWCAGGPRNGGGASPRRQRAEGEELYCLDPLLLHCQPLGNCRPVLIPIALHFLNIHVCGLPLSSASAYFHLESFEIRPWGCMFQSLISLLLSPRP